jgi:hypothetical protein
MLSSSNLPPTHISISSLLCPALLTHSLPPLLLSLLCFPVFVLLQIPLHIVEFCHKLFKEEGWSCLYIAPLGIPWVFGRTIYQSCRILIDSLQHCTVLKLDPYGQVTRLDIEHEDVAPDRPWYRIEFPENMVWWPCRGQASSQNRDSLSLLRSPSASSSQGQPEGQTQSEVTPLLSLLP